jgi:manganese-dependent inorganic pyrophosphatase
VTVHVTGHRNPDTDSIASAIAYAELCGRLDSSERYVPARLGAVNEQTRWVLDRAGADEPELLPHVFLRVRDVMQADPPVAEQDAPVRDVGLMMAREGLDLVPLVDADGVLRGLMTERVLAHRYVRESREASRLDAPTKASAVARVLGGHVLAGDPEREVDGRVWVLSMAVASLPDITAGDVVVVGDREDAQRRAIELGAGLVVASNGTRPSREVLEAAEQAGATVLCSPLDSYVTGRMVTLSEPSHALMDAEPLTVRPDDVLDDVAGDITGIHYRAAVVVDGARRPIGLVSRAQLVDPRPRRVILVDHAEQAQSVPGVERAEIVEILDHHHIGSIETRVPVRATFDPVGSTATLIIERFRQNGMEPSRPSAILLAGAILSDTVILNSPTTTARDRAAMDYLERVLAIDATDFGREMFEGTSAAADTPAEEIVARDAKRYTVGEGKTISIAQVETVGTGLIERRDELLEAMDDLRERNDQPVYALMVTDIMAGGTKLLVSGNVGALERAFDVEAQDQLIDLPGVMSRKKQVAPRVLAAL